MKMFLRILVLFSLIFVSCKKDKLKDEKEILVGKWVWSHTYYTYNNCVQCCSVQDTILASASSNSYQLEFLKKGQLKFYKDNELVEKKRVVFKEFYHYGSFGYAFSIYLDNNEGDQFVGIVSENKDSLITWNYPYKSPSDYCEEYENYFAQE